MQKYRVAYKQHLSVSLISYKWLDKFLLSGCRVTYYSLYTNPAMSFIDV